MGLFDNMKGLFSGSDEQEMYNEEVTNYNQEQSLVTTQNRVPVTKPKQARATITVCEPRVYSEVEDMATLLMDRNAIIVNFSKMDKSQAARVIDYLTGIIFAVQGSVQKLQSEIFLFTPSDITIDGVLEVSDAESVDYLDMV